MSLGFGFALPAYPLRGGGGNNPFNQLGPTLDLSFVDGATNVGDQLGPDTYTLNTDFITPEYQVAAQYAIWENGVGLAQKTFSQIVTFSRTSGATWFNSAGVNVGIDFSTSSVTIGTGSKTFTLTATAGIGRSWAAGDIVRISEQATPANFMDGTVTSYTASTQTLVVNVTATGGSGTIASWRVSNWMPRFDYNPATLAARGLLIEEARTNSIRNNTMQGAVAGTPGTQPTNWSIQSPNAGLTREIVGVGTQNGITYIDVRFSGTTTGTSANLVFFEPNSAVAASNGQTWTGTAWIALVGGSFANINIMNLTQRFNDAGGVSLTISGTSILSATSLMNRYSITSTASNASTAFVTNLINASFSVGVAIDITLRIGLPQLELGAFATSVIPTTVASVTRNADQASVNTLAPWYNATEGTLYANVAVDYTMPASLFPALASLNDNTSGNRIELGFVTSSVASFEISVGGSIVTSRYPSTAALNRRVSGAYKANDSAIAVNGAAAQATTPTSASLPTVTKLDIGARASGSRFTGWVQRITYYPRRLSNADLQTITT